MDRFMLLHSLCLPISCTYTGNQEKVSEGSHTPVCTKAFLISASMSWVSRYGARGQESDSYCSSQSTASLCSLEWAAQSQGGPKEGNDKSLLSAVYLENPEKGRRKSRSTWWHVIIINCFWHSMYRGGVSPWRILWLGLLINSEERGACLQNWKYSSENEPNAIDKMNNSWSSDFH